MRILRLFFPMLLLIGTALVTSGYGQEKVTHLASPSQVSSKAAPGNILPESFGGWKLLPPPKFSTDPGAADPTDAPVLKEYGFTDVESATYTRDDGRKLTIKAARFEDASGAYGAFTFYKTPVMINEKIGDQGYSLNNRVLFFRGNILIDALFEKLSAMSAAELRELSGELPRPQGTTANPPSLPAYFPIEHYLKNTVRYVVGPIALEKVESPLPAQLVDFSRGAEVELGDYNLSGAPATLMLINYPTPQIAADQLKNIEAAEQTHQVGNTQIAVRRTGPILAILSGAVSNGDAKSFLGQINYDADVTWNQNTYFTRRDNVANLIVGVILLAAIICGMAVVFGVAFGGFRVLMKKLFPDKVFDRPEQVEIIALHLSEPARKPGDSA